VSLSTGIGITKHYAVTQGLWWPGSTFLEGKFSGLVPRWDHNCHASSDLQRIEPGREARPGFTLCHIEGWLN
jgi:hypothetical protein